MLTHETTQNSRLLAKLVRDLLSREPFESLPDLTEALKVRCARLRIRWSNEDLSDAFRFVGSNTPLPGDHTKDLPKRHIECVFSAPPFSRDEAARIYCELMKRCGTEQSGLRAIQKAPWTDPEAAAREFEAARQRAFEIGIEL